MALMVVVIVAGRSPATNSAELASSENLTVAAADAHTHPDGTADHDHADGTAEHDHADGTTEHDHADGTAAHDHADGTTVHDHADGTTDHDHADGATDDPTHCHTDCAPGTPEDPTHCHVDCTPGEPPHEHPTEPATYTQTQLDLLAATQAWISPRFDNTSDAVAAGYTSIGDSGTGFEHFINNSYLNSSEILNPATVEALVYQVSGNTRTLVSGMYLLPIGQTLDNVPAAFDTPQTPWHIHTNLCWKLNPIRVVGTTSTGQAGCPDGSIYFATPPMMHVWLQPQTCGWFSDLDQVQSGDCGAHPH